MLSRTTPPLILTLTLTASVSALSQTIILPSLPSIAHDFQTDYSVVQLLVSVYLIAIGVAQMVAGPLSDRFGRRNTVIGCIIVFELGTLGAIFAPSIGALIVCRVLQAASAGCVALSRTIIRDTAEPLEAASKIGYVTMGMALVPMIAPILGGVVDEIYGWHGVFVLALMHGALVLALVLADLGETNKHRSASFAAQFRSYPELLGSKLFWGYTLAGSCTIASFFAFVGGGPFVGTTLLGMSPSVYGFHFAFLSAGYMAGNFITARLSARTGLQRMIIMGNLLSLAGAGGAAALCFFGMVHPLIVFGAAGAVGAGNGMALPCANVGLISVHPRLAGSASGLGGAVQMLIGSMVTTLATTLLTIFWTPTPMLAVMSFVSIGAVLAVLFIIRRHEPKT